MSITNDGVLERKISALFPEQREMVAALLSEYGIEEYEREPDRVKLAALKLSGGNINKIKEYVHEAKIDYRDVLAWAEYPEEMKIRSWERSSEEMREIRERDRKQYDLWLEE